MARTCRIFERLKRALKSLREDAEFIEALGRARDDSRWGSLGDVKPGDMLRVTVVIHEPCARQGGWRSKQHSIYRVVGAPKKTSDTTVCVPVAREDGSVCDPKLWNGTPMVEIDAKCEVAK